MARTGAYGRFADRVARLFDLSLSAAEELVARIEDPAVFRPFLVPGLAVHRVSPGPSLIDATAIVGRLSVGASFPRHDHVGDETTVVLDGGLRDDDGRTFWRGEELYKPAGSAHDFVAVGDRPCVAAVLCIGGVTFR